MYSTKKILSFGEIIWDIYPDDRYIGGAPLNFAAHCAGCGTGATLLSAVGNDPLGEEAIRRMQGFGVQTDLIQINAEKPTGQCLVKLNAKSVPSYQVLTDTAYDHISLTEDQLAAIRAKRFDVLYFGTLIQRSPQSRAALSALLEACSFPEIFCDLNLRPNCYSAETASLCLRNATILKISDEEEPLLRKFGFYDCFSKDPEVIAKAIASRYSNLKIILITRGSEGSYVYRTDTQESIHQPIVRVPVVSTVGAGDSFAAAWITSYLEELPLALCMRKAAERSAFVVAHKSAVPQSTELPKS
ncbi:MAG: carbohydrate kinase [Ruminococcaceae bacterium]|nr:carbohydrate kinase [Oscillospiraceae bacterium]